MFVLIEVGPKGQNRERRRNKSRLRIFDCGVAFIVDA